MIHTTPVTEIFTPAEVEKIDMMGFRQHECHKNSVMMVDMFDCEYCEGVAVDGVLEHAFNKIERNGRTSYFDVTDHILTQNDIVPDSIGPILLLRLFTKKEIQYVNNRFETYFLTISATCFEGLRNITIDDDGYAKRAGEDYCNSIIKRQKQFRKLSDSI